MEQLSTKDLDFILESLRYTRLKFENYPIGPEGYPSYEFKRERLAAVEEVIGNVAKYKKGLLNNKGT